MRVLLSTTGSRGDVQPLVALASQLRALGQEVHLCVPPDFREWIESFGMSITPIGPAARATPAARASDAQGPPSEERRRQAAERTVAMQFETIAAAARGCDLIVGASTHQIAGPSVAEMMGIPYVFVGYCPVVLPSVHHAPPRIVPGQDRAPSTADNRELWAELTRRVTDTLGPAVNRHRAALRLAPVDDVRGSVITDHPWLAADPTLAPWLDADNQNVVQTGAWMLPDERPLPLELERFLDAGDPPLYFGFGSMRVPQVVAELMISTARAFRRRAIVLRGWADLSLTDGGADCLSIGEVNQQALFTRVAAVVHHGGAGTTTVAARSGAPQVIVPVIYDQYYWARRVVELGVGAAHTPGAPAVDSMAAALDWALKPAVAKRARRLATAVRTDGAQLAAERLIAGRFRA